MDPEFRRVIADRRQAERYTEEVVTEGRLPSTAMAGCWMSVSSFRVQPLPNRLSCLQQILQGTSGWTAGNILHSV
jgi:hypothetical protein